MEVLWYSILIFVVCVYFVLDGYDFGVGIIHLFFAKTEEQKKLIAKSAGLFWDFNEVWLVVAGSLVFMAFPLYYASVFSGFYLPLIILLWLMIFRATGLELRNQFNNEVWKNFWDKSFGISSLLLAVFCGAALGNLVRGVNMGEVVDGKSVYEPQYFFLPLWNEDFTPLSQNVGVLDWFTSLIGLLGLLILAIHGANWIVLKTKSDLIPKLKNFIFYANFAVLILVAVSLLVWSKINHFVYDHFINQWWTLLFPLMFLVGFIGLFFVRRIANPLVPFIFSSLVIVGGIITSFVSMFPIILPSNNSINPPLTIYNTSNDYYGLSVALFWMMLAGSLALIYFVIQKRILAGKIDDLEHHH